MPCHRCRVRPASRRAGQNQHERSGQARHADASGEGGHRFAPGGKESAARPRCATFTDARWRRHPFRSYGCGWPAAPRSPTNSIECGHYAAPVAGDQNLDRRRGQCPGAESPPRAMSSRATRVRTGSNPTGAGRQAFIRASASARGVASSSDASTSLDSCRTRSAAV